MQLRRVLALIVLVIGAAACDDSDAGSAGGRPSYSASDAIGELPTAVDEAGVVLSIGDLVAATEQQVRSGRPRSTTTGPCR